MICYKDTTFCSKEDCENLECKRNMKNIPWNEVPEYMCVSVCDWAGKLGCQENTEEKRGE